MKKTMLIVALVAATVLTAMTGAQASTGALCSSKAVDSEMSRVDVVIDEYSARALILVFAADEDGRPICGQEVRIDTSRNLLFPDGDEDDVVAFGNGITDSEGKVVFMLTPEGEPETTTVFASVNDTWLENIDGEQFSYNPY